NMDQFPDHWGIKFTPTIHTKAEGPTDPKNIKLSSSFVVVVTGAGKGLGYHIALAYAYAGAKGIVISSRTQSDLDKLTAELKAINPDLDIVSQTCDTTKDEEVRSLAEVTKKHFGRLDVVGQELSRIPFPQTNSHSPNLDFERVIDTNFLGSYRVAKHFVPLLQATPNGIQAYVVITSLASQVKDSEMTPIAYNLSKLAVNRMAEQIHADHFERDGVTAFAGHPGTVLTPQTERHAMLTDDVGLCGGFLTWLTKEKRMWLSGRYLSVNWDTEELEGRKDEVVEGDKLTFKMVV
ncbi:uncharacterized protein MYCGRDRAFT_51174, partial [Zymoseptoria tritici IPO323]